MSAAELIDDIGLALTPEQQALAAALPEQPSWEQASLRLALEIRGTLDPQRLRGALARLAERQQALAAVLCRVPGYHGWRQRFPASVAPLLTEVDAAQGESARAVWLARRFSLDALPAADALLLQRGAEDWRLELGVSRLLLDAASLAALPAQLAALYAGEDAEADEEEVGPFSQYLAWRAEVVLDEDAAEARAYWTTHLQGGAEAQAGSRLPYRCGQAGAPAALRKALSEALRQALGASGQEPEMLLQAVWWALLARIAGTPRLLVGVRHDARHDYDYFAGAAGVFERTLPLQLTAQPQAGAASLAAQLAEQLEAHRAWQEYWAPDALAGPALGFASRRRAAPASGGGLDWQAHEEDAAGDGFELLLQLQLDANGVPEVLILRSDTGHYTADALLALQEQYLVLLQGALAEPTAPLASLPLLEEAQARRLHAINPPATPAGAELLPQRFAHWLQQTPEALAVSDASQSLSYAQLAALVEHLAAGLQRLGVAPGATLALALPRSVALLGGILAAWRLGAAYLPLDPQWPPARQLQLIRQTGASVVLGAEPLVADGLHVCTVEELLAAPAAAAPPAHEVAANDVAYVLFTSGSTGTPKGVVIEHGQLLNYVAGASEVLGLERCASFALSSSVAADLGNTTLYGALYNGAALHVADEATMGDARRFAAFLAERRIDCLKIVPSHLAALLDDQPLAMPTTLVLGGEPCAPALLRRLRAEAPASRLFNHYGPSEACVGVMVHPLHGDEEVAPLSRVLPNNRVYVLDEQLRLAPVGVLGEVYLGGAQLCRGYLGGEGAAAFVEDPFHPGQRLYRTGDLARYRPDLAVQLQGRRDQQVKIRGFRVDLTEIESELLRLPAVAEAVVLPGADGEEGTSAFVVLRDAADDATVLRQQLAERLPAAMVPRQVRSLTQLPRLPNGKLDRQALQRLCASETEEYVAPADPLEQWLAARMAALLGRERLGVQQDFFAMGGHSLLVIKLVAGIRNALKCEIQPADLFEHPSVAGLAQRLRDREATPGQLLRLARARLQLDAMSPEEKARLQERARAGQAPA
ncbi:non-ribosomal peptide synthetase family protein [Pseudomonas sp. A6]|uniref:non-ribosomal peptide synthetase family protein n=1 Tax=Pseudomonas sp. A6 TaxID=410021 RepID=UPI00402553EA